MKKATKTEMQALYTAFDIHRRAVTLAAMWTAFDPFGAVVYELRDLESAAFSLREAVNDAKDYWDYTKEPNHPLRRIKEGHDRYETFRNHLKGIEGAIRRLLANKFVLDLIAQEDALPDAIDDLLRSIAELKISF